MFRIKWAHKLWPLFLPDMYVSIGLVSRNGSTVSGAEPALGIIYLLLTIVSMIDFAVIAYLTSKSEVLLTKRIFVLTYMCI